MRRCHTNFSPWIIRAILGIRPRSPYLMNSLMNPASPEGYHQLHGDEPTISRISDGAI